MSLLAVLWWTSLGLVLATLAWMSVLVLARVGRERSGQARDRDRGRLREASLAIVGGAGEAASGLRPFRRRARLMADGFLEFSAIVRGAERERLITAYRLMSADSRFRERLFKGSRPGRLAAAEALAAFPSEETVAALNRLVERSRDPELRASVIRTLVELDRPPDLGGLLMRLEAEQMTTSLVYLPVIRRLVSKSPAEAMMRLDRADTGPAARALLADAVASTGDYRAAAPLESAAQAGEAGVRIAAIRGLGLLSHPGSIPSLIAALSDPDWEVRSAGCEALARTAAVEAVPQLSERLSDTVWWVRFQAAEALSRLGPVGVSALKTVSKSADDLPRRAASLALAEKGLGDHAEVVGFA